MSETAIAQEKKNLPAVAGAGLPYHPVCERYGIDPVQWRGLVDGVFPLATSIESVLMALSYCQARGLDPFKRVCHIVPIWNKQLNRMVDTIWPGIAELRTTATRTGCYAGRDETQFGPEVAEKVGAVALTYPEWAQVTVYRIVQGVRCAFPGPKVRWLETYATAKRDTDDPNEMWRNRPFGQLEKCAEAAALRGAFPEELGGSLTDTEAERLNGRSGVIIETVASTLQRSKADELIERAQQHQQRIEQQPAPVVNPIQPIEEREAVAIAAAQEPPGSPETTPETAGAPAPSESPAAPFKIEEWQSRINLAATVTACEKVAADAMAVPLTHRSQILDLVAAREEKIRAMRGSKGGAE